MYVKIDANYNGNCMSFGRCFSKFPFSLRKKMKKETFCFLFYLFLIILTLFIYFTCTVPFSVLLCFSFGISQLANFELPLDQGRFTFVSVLSLQFQDVLWAFRASA